MQESKINEKKAVKDKIIASVLRISELLRMKLKKSVQVNSSPA
jgi:hypothetical protein